MIYGRLLRGDLFCSRRNGFTLIDTSETNIYRSRLVSKGQNTKQYLPAEVIQALRHCFWLFTVCLLGDFVVFVRTIFVNILQIVKFYQSVNINQCSLDTYAKVKGKFNIFSYFIFPCFYVTFAFVLSF